MPQAPNDEIPYNVPWSAQKHPSASRAQGTHRARTLTRPPSQDALLQRAMEILENPSRPEGIRLDRLLVIVAVIIALAILIPLAARFVH